MSGWQVDTLDVRKAVGVYRVPFARPQRRRTKGAAQRLAAYQLRWFARRNHLVAVRPVTFEVHQDLVRGRYEVVAMSYFVRGHKALPDGFTMPNASPVLRVIAEP